MGLLNTNSIAWAIGQAAAQEGAHVIYSVQSDRYLRTVLYKSFRESGLEIDELSIFECDVQDDQQIERFFKNTGNLHGLVYSIAYANPLTCLGNEPLWTTPREDVLKALDISALGLAYVAGQAETRMPFGGSIVALTFESQSAFPCYNWMGVSKATLEGVVRYLALELGQSNVRVNSLSSGPLQTKAASSIPGFGLITEAWNERSILEWDTIESREDVANSAVYLLSDLSRAVTGTVHYVDGGFHAAAFKKQEII